jgi:hypothetical protein
MLSTSSSPAALIPTAVPATVPSATPAGMALTSGPAAAAKPFDALLHEAREPVAAGRAAGTPTRTARSAPSDQPGVAARGAELESRWPSSEELAEADPIPSAELEFASGTPAELASESTGEDHPCELFPVPADPDAQSREVAVPSLQTEPATAEDAELDSTEDVDVAPPSDEPTLAPEAPRAAGAQRARSPSHPLAARDSDTQAGEHLVSPGDLRRAEPLAGQPAEFSRHPVKNPGEATEVERPWQAAPSWAAVAKGNPAPAERNTPTDVRARKTDGEELFAEAEAEVETDDSVEVAQAPAAPVRAVSRQDHYVPARWSSASPPLPSNAAVGGSNTRFSPAAAQRFESAEPALDEPIEPSAPFASRLAPHALESATAKVPTLENVSQLLIKQLVEPALRALGIDPAKVATTMENVAPDASSADAAPAGGAVNSAWAPSATRAMERVIQAAELMRATERPSLQLNLDFGDSGPLSVHISLRQGRVHTLFRSDSAELRDTIAQAWNTFSKTVDSSVALAEPLLLPLRASSSQSETGKFTGHFSDSNAHSEREARESREQASGRSGGRRRGSVPAAVTAPVASGSRAHPSSSHLSVLA